MHLYRVFRGRVQAGERRPAERAVFLGSLYGSLNVVLLPFIVAFRPYAMTRLARGFFNYSTGLAMLRADITNDRAAWIPFHWSLQSSKRD